LNKDKEYNYCVSLIRDNEKEKMQLKNEIAELQEQFIELKNEGKISNSYMDIMCIVLIDEETEENFKNINAIHIDRIEEDEEALIKKERELMKTLFLLQQKHKDINLAYENVMENMKSLIAYQDENINPNHEELKEEEKNTEDESQHIAKGEPVDVNANEGEQQGEEAENKEPEEEKDPLKCLLCQIMNAMGHRHHAFSELRPDKLTDIFGGNAEIVIELGGPEKAYNEDSFEEMLKDILPIVSTSKKYSKDDIKEIRSKKAEHGTSMKRLLSLLDDDKILKAFHGM
jgi:hypothetical protein